MIGVVSIASARTNPIVLDEGEIPNGTEDKRSDLFLLFFFFFLSPTNIYSFFLWWRSQQRYFTFTFHVIPGPREDFPEAINSRTHAQVQGLGCCSGKASCIGQWSRVCTLDAVREPEYLRKIVRAERGNRQGGDLHRQTRQAAFMLFYSTRHLFT